MRGEVKEEFERIEVDERGDEGLSDIVGDAEEKQRGLDNVRFPSEMEAPDVLRQMRTSRERLAAAERGDGHGRHHHDCRRRRRLKGFDLLFFQLCGGCGCGCEGGGWWRLGLGGTGQDFVEEDGGVEDTFGVGAPLVGDERDACECARREVVTDGTEYLVWEAVFSDEVCCHCTGCDGSSLSSSRRWKKHGRSFVLSVGERERERERERGHKSNSSIGRC